MNEIDKSFEQLAVIIENASFSKGRTGNEKAIIHVSAAEAAQRSVRRAVLL